MWGKYGGAGEPVSDTGLTRHLLQTRNTLSLRGCLPYQPPAAVFIAANRATALQMLLAAMARTESSFDPSAVSPAGAQGLMQLMPATAAGLGVNNPMDPKQNVEGGVKYLAQQLKAFDGDPKLALAAYNAGPAPVQACGCVPHYPETQAYVAKILGILGGAGELTGQAFEVRLVE